MKKKHKKQLEECRIKALGIVSMYLDILLDEEKASAAPVNQLSSVIGVMMDRFAENTNEKDNGMLPEILKTIHNS